MFEHKPEERFLICQRKIVSLRYPPNPTTRLFLSGVIGNFLVIFALVGDKKARNATSAFLVSLAAADLAFLLVCIPYETAAKMTGFWRGGRPLCKISGFVEMLSAVASILNLTAVSVERSVIHNFAFVGRALSSTLWLRTQAKEWGSERARA